MQAARQTLGGGKTLTLLKGRFVPKVLRPLSRFFIIMGCSTATSSLGGISKVGADDLLAIVIWQG
jgi:hypothetical protein